LTHLFHHFQQFQLGLEVQLRLNLLLLDLEVLLGLEAQLRLNLLLLDLADLPDLSDQLHLIAHPLRCHLGTSLL
jgi:hypothetical protein